MIAIPANGDAETLVQLVFMLVFGGVCAVLANNRGRSGVAWFFIGFFFSCFGLILLLCLPDVKQQEEREQRHREETRRLREQIAKERQVSDARHNDVQKRLVVHDQALGVDTTPQGELSGGVAAPLLPGEQQPQWFYARDNQRHGPVSWETVQHLLAARALTRDSLVLREGMADWAPMRDVAEFGRGAS
jgi:hypothetical protein